MANVRKEGKEQFDKEVRFNEIRTVKDFRKPQCSFVCRKVKTCQVIVL